MAVQLSQFYLVHFFTRVDDSGYHYLVLLSDKICKYYLICLFVSTSSFFLFLFANVSFADIEALLLLLTLSYVAVLTLFAYCPEIWLFKSQVAMNWNSSPLAYLQM